MYVCLTTCQNIVVKGEMRHYRPGDWVNVGKQTAQNWIASGCARAIDPDQIADSGTATSGIVVRGFVSDEWRSKLQQVSGLKLLFEETGWTPSLPFTETLIWRPDAELRLDLLITGFNLLKKWQMAVPLYDYTTLAAHVGTQTERDATQAVIRDLRVPLRDTRVLFVRRCQDTRHLMQVWAGVLRTCPEERLAFMQALYAVKPLVCDLPATWAGRR